MELDIMNIQKMRVPSAKVLYDKYKMYEGKFLNEESARYKFESLTQMRNYGLLLQKALMLDSFQRASTLLINN
jgi:hypothetical protein